MKYISSIFITIILLTVEVSSLSIKKLTISELSEKANLIIHAKCEDIETKKGEYNLTYTYTKFKILEVIKGTYDDSHIVLRSFGDMLDSKIIAILGIIKFTKDEQVILFLTAKDRLGYPHILGVNQGSYKLIKKDKKYLINQDGKNIELDSFKKEISKYITK